MTLRSARPSDQRQAWAQLALALCCLLVLLSSTRAQAQTTQSVDLAWTAPPECPRLEDVQARIRKLAGTRKWSAVPLRAEAIVERKDDNVLHLRLVLHAGDMVEERNIDGTSCRALAGATAVVVALMFRSGGLPPTDGDQVTSTTDELGPDGKSSDSAGSPDGSGGEPKRPDGTGAEPPPLTEVPKPDTPRRWRGLAQLPLGVVSLGPLATPSLGVAAAGGVSVDQWRFLVRGTAWLSQYMAGADEFEPYGARIRRTSWTLLACRSLLVSRFEIAPCAAFSLLHLSARGQAAHIAPHTATATWAAAGVGLHARYHVVSWMSLVLSADGELGFSRPELVVGGVGQVQALGPGSATLGLGTEWIL
jgi:hypothetical protein